MGRQDCALELGLGFLKQTGRLPVTQHLRSVLVGSDLLRSVLSRQEEANCQTLKREKRYCSLPFEGRGRVARQSPEPT